MLLHTGHGGLRVSLIIFFVLYFYNKKCSSGPEKLFLLLAFWSKLTRSLLKIHPKWPGSTLIFLNLLNKKVVLLPKKFFGTGWDRPVMVFRCKIATKNNLF